MSRAATISAPPERRFAHVVSDRSRDAGTRAPPARTIVGGPDTAIPSQRVPQLRNGAILQVIASLIWIPQAALLSMTVGRMATGDAVETAYSYAALILALGIAKSGLDAIGARMSFRQARAFLSDQRWHAVAVIASRSPLDIERPASGFAASVLAEQTEAIVPYLSRFQPARLRATLVPIAILLCVFVYSWAAAFVLLLAAPLIPIFMALIGWRAKAASEAQLVELGSMNAFLLDRLRGLATIRSLRAVDITARRLRADAENLRQRTMAVLKIAFLSSAVLELFAALGVAMVAVYVGFHLLGQLPFGAWGNTLSLGEGLFVLLLAPAFFEPLRDLSAVWHDRAAGEASLEALRGLSNNGAEFLGSKEPSLTFPSRSADPVSIRVEHLSFRYAAGHARVLDDFSLDVKPGEHIALIAPSGQGKSTLLALLAGLAVAESGRIVLGEHLLSEDTAAGMRGRIAWIGQHPHVFAGTLSQNITLGREGVSAEMIRGALARVGLENVARRRGAVSVGESGGGLSGGEASRLALARVAAMPGVGLILADEPTAHLDSETARSITDALCTLARGRTLIVATHDPVLATRMDRIVRLGAISHGSAA